MFFQLSGSVVCHVDHLCAKSSGTSSSHSMFLFHNSCIINFGSRTAGFTKPSGSKMILIKLRISLLVAGSFFSTDLILNVSFSGCRSSPRAITLEFHLVLGLYLLILQCLLMARTLKCLGYLMKTSLVKSSV